jgi:hydrogenase maturation protease
MMRDQDFPGMDADRPSVEAWVEGRRLKRGDRVRLRPKPRGDVFDIALTGKIAIIESIEQDFEGVLYVAVVVEEDPGSDVGMMRMPAHRFFYGPEEIEPFGDDEVAASSQGVLVAGIGNIFLGDDGFGVEVANQLASRPRVEHVRVADYGIRGFDLAYALLAGPALTIIVDACARGGVPGTLYVIDPDLASLELPAGEAPMLDPHSLDPLAVLRLAKSLGGETLRQVRIVGCEPATLGPEEGSMELSAAVAAAVDPAVALIESLVAAHLSGGDGPQSQPTPSSQEEIAP